MIIPYISSVVDDRILTENSYEKLSVLDSCYDSINEGVTDSFVVNIASTYTYSMITEVLDNIKETLLKLAQQVLTYLNNYILNTATIADKYRNLIINRFSTLKEPFVYYTYEYPKPKFKDYPVLVKSSTSLELEIETMQDEILEKALSPDQAGDRVDKMLRSFGNDVLDARVDVSDLKNSTQKIIRSKLQGRQIQKKLTERDLDSFIDEIKAYKTVKDDISRTKNNIISDYNNLKRIYTSLMKEKESAYGFTNDLKKLRSPEAEELKAYDYQRFANINLHLTRLFNGFITIYSSAFDTKLNIINEKIDANRAIIVELLTKTGIFTAVNTKSPNKQKKPYVFNPELKT